MKRFLKLILVGFVMLTFASPVMAESDMSIESRYGVYQEYKCAMVDSQNQEEALMRQLIIVNEYITEKYGAGRDLTLYEFQYMIYLASRCNVELKDILATIDLESNFDRGLVGSSGEIGWMQIMPETAQWVIFEHGYRLGMQGEDITRVQDPIINLKCGILFKWVLQQDRNYKGDRHAILTAYNRGPYSAERYFRDNQTYRSTYSRAIVSREEAYLSVLENDQK